MNVMLLTLECAKNSDCSLCECTAECKKYQKMIECVNLSRPDMLNTSIDYLIDLYHSKANLSE